MKRFALVRFILAVFLCSSPMIHAQVEEKPQMAFDCWISTDGRYSSTHHIACILDRDDFPPVDDALDPPEAITLDRIHWLLHGSTVSELETYVWDNEDTLQKSDLRKIRIYSYPSPWAWYEESPQLLVQMLCPEGYDCPVFFRR